MDHLTLPSPIQMNNQHMTVADRATEMAVEILNIKCCDVRDVCEDNLTACLDDYGVKPEELSRKGWDINRDNVRIRNTMQRVRQMLGFIRTGDANDEFNLRNDIEYLLGHVETRLL